MLKILHVASFIGNIGDNASHAGLYNILDKLIGPYSVDCIEMREFYLNYKAGPRRFFDESFVSCANKYDLVIIGGGGFLDYWVPDSPTGTTISMEPSLLSKLKSPTLFTSMGSLPKHDVPDGNIEKYKRFLDCVFESENIKIAVRNDGSLGAIKRDLGKRYSQNITEILDNGFFYDVKGHHPRIVSKEYVAINLATDQLRLCEYGNASVSLQSFFEEMQRLINHAIKKLGLHVVMIPHVHGDLEAINRMLPFLDDFDVRKSITVAPCIQDFAGMDYIFSLYKESTAIIANRLHANICGLVLNERVIGIAALERVKSIHESVGSDLCVSAGENFSGEVIETLNNVEKVNSAQDKIHHLKQETSNFYKTVLDGVV